MTGKDTLRQQYLNAMGIQQWVLRDVPLSDHDDLSHNHLPASEPSEPSEPPEQLSEVARMQSDLVKRLDWGQLQTAVQNCTACQLSESRTRTVFGSGHPQARLMIIGEAPGADEDRQGLPFVGKAGQLLTEMLAAIGFARDQVFIANTLKCRPPNNRDPSITETASCEPFLLRQIDLIAPKVILAVGRVAAHNILKTSDSLARLRSKQHSFHDRDLPVYVSYHPAYLLRSPSDKAKAWQDLKQVKQLLDQS